MIALVSVPAVRLFGRRRAFPLLLLIVFAYTVFVGASAAVVRAAIMGALVLWATYLGRQTVALNSLFIAAIVMTLLDPFTLGDVGFQLSCAATLGLVLYTRPLQAGFERGLTRLVSAEASHKVVGALGDAVIVTLAASLTTLPILVVVFRQLSLVWLAVNALALPAQSGVMLFGGLALLAGMLFLPLGQIVGWAAWLFLTWTLQAIHLFAQVPGAALELGYVDPLWGVGYVVVLAAVTWYATRGPEQRSEVRRHMARGFSLRFVLPALGIVVLLGAVALSWRPDGRLHVHALDVEGMPVFIQTPAGRQILVGGSSSPSALLAALGSRMPFWDRDLDVVVVPKTDAQLLNGLMAVVDRYHIGAIVSVEVGDNRAAREWLDMIAAQHVEVIESGLGIGIEDGVSLSLDESGWVQIDAAVTSVGLGQPAREDHADVLVLTDAADDTAARVQSMQPTLVIALVPIEPMEGVTLVDAQRNAVELLFDGAQWEVRAAP